jgi:Flagellar hook-length control protein FliK
MSESIVSSAVSAVGVKKCVPSLEEVDLADDPTFAEALASLTANLAANLVVPPPEAATTGTELPLSDPSLPTTTSLDGAASRLGQSPAPPETSMNLEGLLANTEAARESIPAVAITNVPQTALELANTRAAAPVAEEAAISDVSAKASVAIPGAGIPSAEIPSTVVRQTTPTTQDPVSLLPVALAQFGAAAKGITTTRPEPLVSTADKEVGGDEGVATEPFSFKQAFSDLLPSASVGGSDPMSLNRLDTSPTATNVAPSSALSSEAGFRAAPPPISPRPATLAIDAQLPLHSPRFAEGFAQQITVLVEHGIQHARISLNPPELGPVDVRITFQHDEATVQLASQHGAVRDAMTEALPRLRESLEQTGVRLNDTGVFAQLPQREQASSGHPMPQFPNDTGPEPRSLNHGLPTLLSEQRSLRLIDAYV